MKDILDNPNEMNTASGGAIDLYFKGHPERSAFVNTMFNISINKLKYFLIAVALILTSSIIDLFVNKSGNTTLITLVIIVVASIIFIIFRRSNNIYTESDIYNQPSEYWISNEFLRVKSLTSDTTLQWSGVIKIQDFKDFFLLYLNKRQAVYIYKPLISAGDVQQLHRFLKSLNVSFK